MKKENFSEWGGYLPFELDFTKGEYFKEKDMLEYE